MSDQPQPTDRPQPTGALPESSVYARLGGQAAIAHVVDLFYERVLADDHLAPSFAGVDMGRLRRHQAALLNSVLGGPSRYAGRELTQAHGRLHVTTEDFRRVADHLVAVLHKLDVDPGIVDQVPHALVSLRPSIVTPSPADSAPPAEPEPSSLPGWAVPSPPAWAGPTPPAGIQSVS